MCEYVLTRPATYGQVQAVLKQSEGETCLEPPKKNGQVQSGDIRSSSSWDVELPHCLVRFFWCYGSQDTIIIYAWTSDRIFISRFKSVRAADRESSGQKIGDIGNLAI